MKETLKDHLLIIPEKFDYERESVAKAWASHKGEILRLGRFWDPPTNLERTKISLYGNEAFCLVLAQKFNLTLVSPADDLILSVNPKRLGRDVSICSLIEVKNKIYPLFIKSVIPKQFKSVIYNSYNELLKACQGMDLSTKVITSTIVNFTAEARLFIHNKEILDCAIYEGTAEKDDAIKFVESLCGEIPLPHVCIIDVGLTSNQWVFIEANSVWGGGLNGCSADKILSAIKEATMAQ